MFKNTERVRYKLLTAILFSEMNVNAGKCPCIDGSGCLGLMVSKLTLVFS